MQRILIANRGEIARRVIRTAYAMGIETVAVYSETDSDSLPVREATFAYALGGASAADSYLKIDRLLQAASESGANAVHPGYGFLSEDAGFAQAVIDAGLIWIGPSPAAMRSVGTKSGAKALATQCGVPVLPGYTGADQSDQRFAEEAAGLGFPLMVKAVAGGGGRGMRRVDEPEQLVAALASARSEALSSFGNSELLIERALLNPRHVEVQIFADAYGACIHLGVRDCSVQRRHQKIIEEAPSPGVSPELRESLGRCAIALAQAAGYVGAGTVEFLLDADGYYLMEMNTRLQVEHPVTEALTGLDLVEWQIRVARGERLPLTQSQVQFSGHALEVRLCAEDENFQPQSGRLLHFRAPECVEFQASLRGGLPRLDHAIESGLRVSPYFDALLGKLIVHAADRATAVNNAVHALAQIELLGLSTNRGFLIGCLTHPLFGSGQASISFLAEYGGELRQKLVAQEREQSVLAGLAAVYEQGVGESGLMYAQDRPIRLRHREHVSALRVREVAPGCLSVVPGAQSGGVERRLQLSREPTGRLHCVLDGVSQSVQVVRLGPQRWHVQVAGVDCVVQEASYEARSGAAQQTGASELRAPFNGRVVKVAVLPGQSLAAGESAVVLDSMKLEHSLSSPVAARVAEVLVSPGQQVQPGQILLRLSPPLAAQSNS